MSCSSSPKLCAKLLEVSSLTPRWCLLRRGSRPLVVQQAMDMGKRLKGPPQGGDAASIVVTDIEGFSSEWPG